MNLCRVLPVLDCLLASFASHVMGFVLHGDFTLQNLITLAVLESIFLSFWRHSTVLRQRNLLHDLITRVFLQNLQYGVVVLGFFDAFCLCPSLTPP